MIALLIWRVGQYSPVTYRGGLVLLSLATVAVVAAAACPGSLVGLLLGWRPLRWLGVRSYGIYLWHYPVIVLTSPANTGEDLPRAAAQVAASVLLAALSWQFVEEPVRHGAIGRLAARVRQAGWQPAAGPAGRPGGRGRRVRGAGRRLRRAGRCLPGIGPVPRPGRRGLPDRQCRGGAGHQVGHPGRRAPQVRRRARARPAPAGDRRGPPRTSCRAVAHLGDSTSEGLVSSDYLPDPAKRIPERYEDVGVQTVRTDISGARSVVEVLPGQVNGYDAARAMVGGGIQGLLGDRAGHERHRRRGRRARKSA